MCPVSGRGPAVFVCVWLKLKGRGRGAVVLGLDRP